MATLACAYATLTSPSHHLPATSNAARHASSTPLSYRPILRLAPDTPRASTLTQHHPLHAVSHVHLHLSPTSCIHSRHLAHPRRACTIPFILSHPPNTHAVPFTPSHAPTLAFCPPPHIHSRAVSPTSLTPRATPPTLVSCRSPCHPPVKRVWDATDIPQPHLTWRARRQD